jgi:hypothetical protein
VRLHRAAMIAHRAISAGAAICSGSASTQQARPRNPWRLNQRGDAAGHVAVFSASWVWSWSSITTSSTRCFGQHVTRQNQLVSESVDSHAQGLHLLGPATACKAGHQIRLHQAEPGAAPAAAGGRGAYLLARTGGRWPIAVFQRFDATTPA